MTARCVCCDAPTGELSIEGYCPVCVHPLSVEYIDDSDYELDFECPAEGLPYAVIKEIN